MEPWPKPLQNLRVSRENELLQEGEYRADAIHAFIGHSEATFKSNYKKLNDADFMPKSQRHTPALEKFPKCFPKTDRTDVVIGELKNDHKKKTPGKTGSLIRKTNPSEIESSPSRSATFLSPLFLMWSYLVKCGHSWSFVVTEPRT